MNFGYLSQVFSKYAWKRITAVETDPAVSNGHEFNSSGRLRDILGDTPRKAKEGSGIPAVFVYIDDSENESIRAEGMLSWYDSRANQPHRAAEWRLYYTDNSVIGADGLAQAGDSLVIAFAQEEASATVFIAESGTTAESQLLWLFGLGVTSRTFETAQISDQQLIDASRARILEAAGIVVTAQDDVLLERMLALFGERFPSSRSFSDFVREHCEDQNVRSEPDKALLKWMEMEEFAFRILERFLVGRVIKEGFSEVDTFVAFSLSVQNRRKARAGLAFENHLAEVFRIHGLKFARGAKLENKAKPDFLFPGITHYCDQEFPVELLTLLGAKTTCKDRWRQVLAEGKRLSGRERHLITLEPAISSNQLAEMRDNLVRLIVPRSLHATYPVMERSALWDVDKFVSSVREKQASSDLLT